MESLANIRSNESHGYTFKDIKFKNYTPISPDLQIQQISAFKEIKDLEKKQQKFVRKNVKEFLNLDKDSFSLTPRPQNEDLKRELADRMVYLNKKTELAIGEMLLGKQRERNNSSM